MSDPFRDNEGAAHERVAILEEENANLEANSRALTGENERLRAQLSARPPSMRRSGALLISIVWAVVASVAALFLAVTNAMRVEPPPAPPAETRRASWELPQPSPPPRQSGWIVEAHVTDTDLQNVAYVAPLAFAVGKHGTILRHYDGQQTHWTTETSGTTRDLFGVTLHGESVACAVGAAGFVTCLESDVWKVQKTPTQLDLLAIARDEGDVAVGRSGTILRRDAHGWSIEPSGTKHDLFAVASGWAVGAGGTVLQFDREKHRWQAVESGTQEDLHGVIVDHDVVVVAGAHGVIRRRTDPRAGFQAETSTSTHDLLDAATGFAGILYAVGTGGTLVYSYALLETNRSWQTESTSTSMDLRSFAGSRETMFAVGDHGTIITQTH